MTSSSEPMRRALGVLVVDDSELIRAMLSQCISAAGDFEVVGEAATGYQAIRQVHELEPDIVTLDLQMPDLGGLEALGYIMSEAPRPVVIVSSHTQAMADPALQAMLQGAVEFVPKPLADTPEENQWFRIRLEQALRTASMARLLHIPERMMLATRRPARAGEVPDARCIVTIAASTGGPGALTEVVPHLPGDLRAAVVIVQHMPPLFTASLARRLNDISALPVQEAVHHERVLDGVVYLAPGGRHLELERHDGTVRFVSTEDPPLWGVRPAADVLFRAAARMYGPAAVGVVLTGMGRDGADGLRSMHEAGAATGAQSEDTAVIASMPRAAAPHADSIVPLAQVAPWIASHVAAFAERTTARDR